MVGGGIRDGIIQPSDKGSNFLCLRLEYQENHDLHHRRPTEGFQELVEEIFGPAENLGLIALRCQWNWQGVHHTTKPLSATRLNRASRFQ